MASLVKRPDSSVWYLQYYLSGKLRRVSTETDSLQIAKEKLRQFESAQARGEAIHAEHAKECCALLEELTQLSDARLTGIDPRTGSKPRTANTRAKLAEFLESEPLRVTQSFHDLIAAYEDGFGEEAAMAFKGHLLGNHPAAQSIPELDPEYEKLTAFDASPFSASDNPAEATSDARRDDRSAHFDNSLPIPRPLPEAIARGAFGRDEEGTIDPSEEEVAEISQRHGEKLLEVLERLNKVSDGESRTNDSDDVKSREREAVCCEYKAIVAAFEDDFGKAACVRLEAWAQREIRLQAHKDGSYDPGHPWYYYSEGDGQKPVPVEEIRGNPKAGEHMTLRLPKNRMKRATLLRKVLEEQIEQLDEDKRRYQELVERGPAALSDYDKKIAHGGNEELAWASAIALKYNHISNGVGRVAWLQHSIDPSSKR